MSKLPRKLIFVLSPCLMGIAFLYFSVFSFAQVRALASQEAIDPLQIAEKIETFFENDLMRMEADIAVRQLQEDGSWIETKVHFKSAPQAFTTTVFEQGEAKYILSFDHGEVSEVAYLDASAELIDQLKLMGPVDDSQPGQIRSQYRVEEKNRVVSLKLPIPVRGCSIGFYQTGWVGPWDNLMEIDDYSQVRIWTRKIRSSKYVGSKSFEGKDYYVFQVIHSPYDLADKDSVQLQEEFWMSSNDFQAGHFFISRVRTQWLNLSGQELYGTRDRQFKITDFELSEQASHRETRRPENLETPQKRIP